MSEARQAVAPPRLAAVVCTLDEEDEIEDCVLALRNALPRDSPIVVADGGSRDETRRRVPSFARLVEAGRGRGRQLNAGAAAVAAETLVFVHADCRLPERAGESLLAALDDEAVVGGAFHKRWSGTDRRLACGARVRTAAWYRAGWLFGDQAIFVRRRVFEDVGGFAVDADCEDLDLVLRLRRRGRLVLLPEEVTVSPRRLERDGIVRTWLRWWGRGIRQGIRTEMAARRHARRARAET